MKFDRKHLFKAKGVVALLAAATLATAACGSSSKTTSNTTATTVGSASSATTAAGNTATTTAAGNTGSSVAPASGTPIKVGFVAPTSGTTPFPTETLAIKGAVKYVNSVLGGVNGHPLQVDVCQTDETAQTNVNCANTFVSNGDVVVGDGYDTGDGAEQPILDRAGISLVGVVAGNSVVDQSPNDFFFGPADDAFAFGPFQILKRLGITHIAFDSPNVAADQTYVSTAIVPAAKASGITVDALYYDPTNTDWAVIASTLLSKNAQMIGTIAGSEAQCSSMLSALRAANAKPQIFLGGCSDFVKTDGVAQAAGVYSYTALWQPDNAAHAPAVIQQQLAAYKTAMTAVNGQSVTDQHGVAAFATVVDLDEVLSMIKGDITPQTVKAQFAGLKNWQPFLDPPATCDHQQFPGESTCTATILVTKIAPDGGTAPATGQGFQPITPPAKS